MNQIAKIVQLFTNKLKSYIVVGFVLVLVPSFALSQNFYQNQENGNKPAEKIVPNIAPYTAPVGPPYGTIFTMNKPVTCNDTSILKNYIQNMNGMIPITMGTNKNRMGAIQTIVQLYANPITEKFAIVEHFAFLKSCIILQGHDFDIILPERYYRPRDGSKRPERQAYKLRYTQ